MELTKIGSIHSEIKEGIDHNWGNIISEIHLLPEYKDAIKGLDDFSHIIVIFYMHKASFSLEEHLQRKPQGIEELPKIGIFSQRAKHRPNPIGITTVKLLEIKNDILIVQGLDAIDNTPVLDIKPYFLAFDYPKGEIKEASWVNTIMDSYF
ncbi:MAG: tRNA (N6-threonylcarbamoyladenosine(37)-N6)-methyltransferase TrmO [Candidatus Sericytochromatia bacterium]